MSDDGSNEAKTGESDLLIAALVATKLRAAGIGCEIVNLTPTKPAMLRRDRIFVVLALALLTVLAWSYLLWLSADMDMGEHGHERLPDDPIRYRRYRASLQVLLIKPPPQ